MKSKLDVRQITFAALVGAMYVTLSYFGNIFGQNFAIFQCKNKTFLYPTFIIIVKKSL